jgi:hypothetical protein
MIDVTRQDLSLTHMRILIGMGNSSHQHLCTCVFPPCFIVQGSRTAERQVLRRWPLSSRSKFQPNIFTIKYEKHREFGRPD